MSMTNSSHDNATDIAWTIDQARALYHLPHWSGGYFDINQQGQVTAFPLGEQQGPAINFYQLAQHLEDSGLALPVLVRFSDILQHRVASLDRAFRQAMQQENYQAHYTAIYPIKVNQQRHVVQEIIAYGQTADTQNRVGLEAGSKPELLAVLALAPPGGTIICNGYKDREYIRLALIGQTLGLRPYIVVEKAAELALIIAESAALGIRPLLGVRVRLATIGAGKWQNTGGEKAKFGLSSAQVLDTLARLRAAGLLDCLQLMHFHMGSQIANIRDIQRALGEAARYYRQLHQLGAPILHVDVGGGLGIDYDGSQSRNDCSINYSLQEYANNVVYAFSSICQEHRLPPPNLLTECGRAMTAHHAVLITHVTDIEQAPGDTQPLPATADEPLIIQSLWDGLANLGKRSALEIYHDAAYWLSEAHSMFALGVLDLPQRARAEQLYFATCRQIRQVLQQGARNQREILDELNEKLADKYFCNFSLFQSMPDAWAIDQIFPIIPLHRLDERPTRRATLQDLTCDSDGQVSRYVDAEGIETSLPVHAIQVGERYLLGIFLIGAYQEILGDMHNLFGDTHAVNVSLTPDGNYRLVEPETGDTVEDMLLYVHFDVNNFRERYRRRLAETPLDHACQQRYLNELLDGLKGYTYLE